MMKIAMIAALALAWVAAPVQTAQAQSAQALSAPGGRYQVAGKNPNGTTYSGTAEIQATSNNTCRIAWITGSTTSTGICMRSGSVFSAGYRLGNSVGLVIYEIKPDGVIEGIWTVADHNGVGSETLTPLR